MGKLTRYLIPLLKFIIGATVIGGTVYLWRIGRLSGWGEAEPEDQGTGAPPGRLFGKIKDYGKFGAYEIGIGVAAMTGLALSAFALKKFGFKKYAPDSTKIPVANVG